MTRKCAKNEIDNALVKIKYNMYIDKTTLFEQGQIIDNEKFIVTVTSNNSWTD